MSGFLTFVSRHRGQARCINISSGSLSHLFDPALYAGDEVALEVFLAQQALGPLHTKRLPAPAPWYMGIVVLDFDTRQQWDMQTARDLRFLSLSFDGSWVHFSKWRERGWLGQGLVDPATRDLVSPFPASGVRAWYVQHVDAHYERWMQAHPDDFDGYVDTAPRLAIAPPGWTLQAFEVEQAPQLQAVLRDAGFAFSPQDDAEWQQWAREHP